jgi:hypothetical protein
MSLYGAAAVAVAALGAALGVCIRVASSRKKRIESLEAALGTAREEIRRVGEYYGRKEEAYNHAEEKKERLHTGDAVVDFDNSLRLLHGAGGGDKGAGPGA